jgi:hypothetical protein
VLIKQRPENYIPVVFSREYRAIRLLKQIHLNKLLIFYYDAYPKFLKFFGIQKSSGEWVNELEVVNVNILSPLWCCSDIFVP